MTSSSSWKATPTFSPYSSAGRRYSDGVREEDAGLSGCRDQRSGLVGQHLEVELDGVLAGLSADRLVHLSEHETLERVGLQTDRALADLRHELARAREQEVAGEDRDVVAPDGVRAGHPATHVRAVHDVVVVERARWVISSAVAPVMTFSVVPSPSCAVSRVSMGRTRLPPAS
jgi:hypothetical protein